MCGVGGEGVRFQRQSNILYSGVSSDLGVRTASSSSSSSLYRFSRNVLALTMCLPIADAFRDRRIR